MRGSRTLYTQPAPLSSLFQSVGNTSFVVVVVVHFYAIAAAAVYMCLNVSTLLLLLLLLLTTVSGLLEVKFLKASQTWLFVLVVLKSFDEVPSPFLIPSKRKPNVAVEEMVSRQTMYLQKQQQQEHIIVCPMRVYSSGFFFHRIFVLGYLKKSRKPEFLHFWPEFLQISI